MSLSCQPNKQMSVVWTLFSITTNPDKLDDVEYCYNPGVAFSFIQQLSLKAALREWGNNAKVSGEKDTLERDVCTKANV